MIDGTQSLTGTTTSVQVTEPSAAPKVSVSQGNTSQAASLGVGAPVNPVSASARPSVEINSAAADVLSSMQALPAPVDIEAVSRIRAAISANEYPLNMEKVAASLADAFQSLD